MPFSLKEVPILYENPALQAAELNPLIFLTAFRKAFLDIIVFLLFRCASYYKELSLVNNSGYDSYMHYFYFEI